MWRSCAHGRRRAGGRCRLDTSGIELAVRHCAVDGHVRPRIPDRDCDRRRHLDAHVHARGQAREHARDRLGHRRIPRRAASSSRSTSSGSGCASGDRPNSALSPPAATVADVTGNLLVFLGAALASAVEMVEALTIVLALGVTRGWRAPLQGAAAALVVLVVLVALARPRARGGADRPAAARRRLAPPRLRAAVAAQGDPPRERAQGRPRRGGGVRRGGGRGAAAGRPREVSIATPS